MIDIIAGQDGVVSIVHDAESLGRVAAIRIALADGAVDLVLRDGATRQLLALAPSLLEYARLATVGRVVPLDGHVALPGYDVALILRR